MRLHVGKHASNNRFFVSLTRQPSFDFNTPSKIEVVTTIPRTDDNFSITNDWEVNDADIISADEHGRNFVHYFERILKAYKFSKGDIYLRRRWHLEISSSQPLPAEDYME